MREATGQGGLDSEDAVRLRELERTAAVNKSLFEDFLQKAKVTRRAVDISGARRPGHRARAVWRSKLSQQQIVS